MKEILMATLLLPLAFGQTAASATDAEDWRFVINFPMVWLPDIKGKVDTDGDRTDIDIPISDILDNLATGFIGELYVYRGPWGLSWRSMFLGTETSTSTEAVTGIPGRPPIVGRHRLKVENDLFTSDLVGSYRLDEHIEVYTGVRRTGNKTKFRIEPLEDGLINLKGRYTVVDEDLYDWIVGITLNHSFNHAWSGVLQMDMGLDGDNDSNQFLNGFLSYEFDNSHALWFGYRYLKIGNKFREDGSRVETEFIQSGPTLGWAWNF
jgi:hypothetical protein